MAVIERGPQSYPAAPQLLVREYDLIYILQGCVAIGSDADIVVWDPEGERTISAKSHQNSCDFNVFEGKSCVRGPQFVVSAGHVIVDESGVSYCADCCKH